MYEIFFYDFASNVLFGRTIYCHNQRSLGGFTCVTKEIYMYNRPQNLLSHLSHTMCSHDYFAVIGDLVFQQRTLAWNENSSRWEQNLISCNMENNPAKSAHFTDQELFTPVCATHITFPLSATDRSLLSMETSSTTNVRQFSYLYDI